MNVFPESMNKIDANDPKTAISQLDNYIRYIVERVQYSAEGLLKSVQAGMTTAEVIQNLTVLQQQVSSALSTISGYSARINTLENNTAGLPDLEDEVDTLRGELSDAIGDIELLQSDVGDIQDDISDIQGDILTISGDITSLEETLPQTGITAPGTSTEGSTGQLYIDTVTGKVYIMTGENQGDYIWREITLTAEPEPEPEPEE